MTRLRVGTRGSDLALWQTRWVCDRLREAHADLEIEEIIIKTHGDLVTDKPFDGDWPVGSFVTAIEQALTDKEVDFAVHSFKDLPSAITEGLVISAIPQRQVVHDVLLTSDPMELANLPSGYKIGTSSPRRSAQLLRDYDVTIVPIRGNVPTRVAKVNDPEYDAVVLAAAGLTRLGIEHPYVIDLPTDRFVPAPAQGALAIQTRENEIAGVLVGAIDHKPSRCAVEAERSFLHAVGAGCQTPVGALATIKGQSITLHGQLFSDDGCDLAESKETGNNPLQIGISLAERLVGELSNV